MEFSSWMLQLKVGTHRMARPEDTNKWCEEEGMEEGSNVKADRDALAPVLQEDVADLQQQHDDPENADVRKDDEFRLVHVASVTEDTEKSVETIEEACADVAHVCPLRSDVLNESEDIQQPNFPSRASADPTLPDLASSIVEAMQANVTDLPPVVMPTSRSVASIEV